MELHEYADREMLAMSVANIIAGDLKAALLTHDTASFAVAGGTSPGPIFDLLSATELAWDKVQVMPSDERWVPQSHEASNAALIKTRLITDKAAGAVFVPFFVPDIDVAEGCAQVSAQIDPHLPLSVVLLGMGADMHTASLFPGADGTQAAMAPDAPHLSPVQPKGELQRVTLSAAVLNGALAKHLIIFGDEKRTALDRALTLTATDAPVAAVLAGAHIHWAA